MAKAKPLCPLVNHPPATQTTLFNTDPAAEMLDKVKGIVTGARRNSYGNPEDNFATIAEFWTTYLRRRKLLPEDVAISAVDVSAMCIFIKMARIAETPDHEDSWMDTAGYAACGYRTTKV